MRIFFGIILCIISFFIIIAILMIITDTFYSENLQQLGKNIGGLILGVIMLLIFGLPAFFLLKPKKKSKSVLNESSQSYSNPMPNENTLSKTASLTANNNYSVNSKPISNNLYSQTNQNDLRILQNCQDIMKSTNNLDTFFSRYELGLQIVSKLQNPQYKSNFIGYANSLKNSVLQNSFQNEHSNISKLKTSNAQQKHWENYLELLKRYENYYTTDYRAEYENIVQTVQTKILLVSRGNDISKVAAEILTSNIKVTTVTQTEKKENEATTYIHQDNTNVRSDGKPISDEEVPYLIDMTYRQITNTEDAYKAGQRDIFTDNQFSEEERIFFNRVYANFQTAGLKPNLIKLTRLSSGMFNVDYITQGYVGKVQISESKETYRIIKPGAKRAIRVFDNLEEVEQFINGRSDYTVEHKESKHTYFMQYFIGQNLHADDFSTLQELIDTIPRWVKYVKYMKRN